MASFEHYILEKLNGSPAEQKGFTPNAGTSYPAWSKVIKSGINGLPAGNPGFPEYLIALT
jgi:hypothetical protein